MKFIAVYLGASLVIGGVAIATVKQQSAKSARWQYRQIQEQFQREECLAAGDDSQASQGPEPMCRDGSGRP